MKKLLLIIPLVLALSACSVKVESQPPPPPSSATTTNTTRPTSSTSPTVSPRVTRPTWTTTPVHVSRTPSVPPIPVLVGIRPAQHPEAKFDRVTFDFQGSLPGYDVRYITTPTADGSGEEVDVPGNKYLQIIFSPTDAHKDGKSTVPQRIITNYPQIKSVVVTGDFEAVTTVVLGVNAKAGFQVKELSGRIYIDVAE